MGFNVGDAKVVNKDIVAENGMIQEIDKVQLPLPSLEQYLASNTNYDTFRGLLTKMAYYVSNGDLTHRYQVLHGGTDSVFVKMYNTVLGFAPNNENFTNGGTDPQVNGYTLMVPTNDVLTAYMKKILIYYQTFDAAPPAILNDFINAQMWSQQVWPSRFALSANVQGETPTITTSNVVDKQLVSNGTFYGTNKVQEANVFRTVYSKPYLNPAYSLMTLGLNAELKFSIINPNVKYTVFMMPDVNIRAGYYDFSTNRNAWSYTAPGVATDYSTLARDNYYRILQTCVSQAGINLTNLSGSGIIEMWNNEYVKYNANQLVASGNADAGNYLQIDSTSTTINGNVFYTHEVVPTGKTSTMGLLSYTKNSIGTHLKNLATADPTNFGSFYSFVSGSPLWNVTDAANPVIVGMTSGAFYTIMVPTNAAIVNAVKAGILPGTVATGVPNFAPTVPSDRDKVTKFIQYHIINKTTVVPDGRKDGAFATLLQDSNGNPTYQTIINTVPGTMSIRDAYNNNANVVLSKSNNLSNRCVIHSIDNYLNYIY